MLTVAYIANQFPSSIEPYVADEIRELRRRGLRIVPCSVNRTTPPQSSGHDFAGETLSLRPLHPTLLLAAGGLCIRKFYLLADLVLRVLLHGQEPLSRRLRALLHTWIGAYYAIVLEPIGVQHIHCHHGYSASWIAMVAARLLGIGFSMTLHGSDLLVHHAYLDVKLENCKFCLTISEFNRKHILRRFPQIAAGKIILQRLGASADGCFQAKSEKPRECLLMLAVGRLHPVKDHRFLVRACSELKARRVPFLCLIAGEGPERCALDRLICELDLKDKLKLLGHLERRQLDRYYAVADLVVLTSRSEGIPLVLMEAMLQAKTVLAPAISGIPELVRDGKTGFLYQVGSIEDFVAHVQMISRSQSALLPLQKAAREHVLRNFNRETNLSTFADFFVDQIGGTRKPVAHEDLVLQ